MTLTFASNASKLHKKVGEVLDTTPPFQGCTLQQEVPVSNLFKNYSNNRDRYDWVIPKLNLIIECHGIQHYKFQTFGEDAEVALMKWNEGKRRDAAKKQIALENGWTYIEIPYTDEEEIDSAYLLSQYHQCFNEQEIEQEESNEPEWLEDAKARQKKLGRKARQERYRFLKRLKEERKHEGSS